MPTRHNRITITTDARDGSTVLCVAGANSPEALEALVALQGWLKSIGIDPTDVPAQSPIVISHDRLHITLDRVVRDGNGRLVLDNDHLVAQTTTIDYQQPIPPIPTAVIEAAATSELRETYSVEQIRDAYKLHARPDSWDVPSFYEDGLIAALRGEYDQEPTR